MQCRPQSSDVLSMKMYHSSLYAFHLHQGKMRKAGAMMSQRSTLRIPFKNLSTSSVLWSWLPGKWTVTPIEGSTATIHRRTMLNH